MEEVKIKFVTKKYKHIRAPVAQCPFCHEPASGCECGDAREFW